MLAILACYETSSFLATTSIQSRCKERCVILNLPEDRRFWPRLLVYHHVAAFLWQLALCKSQ